MVAGLVAAAGIVGAVVAAAVGVDTFAGRIDGFDQADQPATLEVEITGAGGWSIYHEYTRAYDGSPRPSPGVAVTAPPGSPVGLDPYEASVTYHASGHEGRGAYTFEAAETGTYAVTASGATGSGIAVGRGVGTGLLAAIRGAVLLGFAGVVAGAVIAIVVGVKRSRSRRTLAPPFGGWGAPVPGGGLPPAGWGPRPSGGGLPPPPPGWGASPRPGGPAAPGPGGRAPTPPPPRPVDAVPPGLRPVDAVPPPPRPGDVAPRVAGPGRGVADPPSLRSQADWSCSDVPLHWSHHS